MSVAADSLFFYHNREFQTQSCMLWGQQLFIEQSLTPESFSTFWDNIHTLRSESKTAYAANQCEILKGIAIASMQIDQRDDGLYISDREAPDQVAVLDYRDSSNGELRGEALKVALESYDGDTDTVYDALNQLINSHHHPTFSGTVVQRTLGLSTNATSIVFRAVDSILMEGEKLPAATGRERLRRNEEIANAAFPQFLAELDRQNVEVLRASLDELGAFGELRGQAIEALLDYREGLFTETRTIGINLSSTKKSSKCQFSEQMVEALFSSEPQEEEAFDVYIDRCIQTAERRLTLEQQQNWNKGFFSHRLRDLINDIKSYEPDFVFQLI